MRKRGKIVLTHDSCDVAEDDFSQQILFFGLWARRPGRKRFLFEGSVYRSWVHTGKPTESTLTGKFPTPKEGFKCEMELAYFRWILSEKRSIKGSRVDDYP